MGRALETSSFGHSQHLANFWLGFRKLYEEICLKCAFPFIGGSQKGGFQKGGFGGCSPGMKTGTRVRSPKPPFWKPPFYLPMTLFGVDKRVVSKRVVSADVPPERKPERGYVRQNHPFTSPTKPPFYLPVILLLWRNRKSQGSLLNVPFGPQETHAHSDNRPNRTQSHVNCT